MSELKTNCDEMRQRLETSSKIVQEQQNEISRLKKENIKYKSLLEQHQEHFNDFRQSSMNRLNEAKNELKRHKRIL